LDVGSDVHVHLAPDDDGPRDEGRRWVHFDAFEEKKINIHTKPILN